jgi:hypothetical protein
MSNISGDENHLCGARLCRSHKSSLKDHMHAQWHGAGPPGDYMYGGTDVNQSDSFA